MTEIRWKLWPKQHMALTSDATEILFGGASEGGKSHLARVALASACLTIPNLQCVLIRKKFSDIIENHVEGPRGFRALLTKFVETRECSVTNEGVWFKNGSNIFFQHCQDERQFDSAQGTERHFIVIDEATQIGERLIRFFRTWCRMSLDDKAALPEEWRGKFPRILYTANPIGASVGFFRRNFVSARPAYETELVDGFLRQYIPSRQEDNFASDKAAFEGRLKAIGDSAIAHALQEGDWESPTGDFYPEWDESRHVIEDYIPDSHWFRFRTFDWGTRDPAVCLFWATSPGDKWIDGRWIPRGALVCYREWYICSDDDPGVGRRLRNEDMRDGIIDRTEEEFRNQITLTDSLPFQDRGGETIADVFWNKGNGIKLTEADTSRVPGWSQLRARLVGEQPDSNSQHRYPLIYFVKSCKAARDYMPALTRHPSDHKKEDAQEHGEATHVCDAIRYACLAHKVIRDAPTPNEQVLRRSIQQMTRRKNIKQLMGDSEFPI